MFKPKFCVDCTHCKLDIKTQIYRCHRLAEQLWNRVTGETWFKHTKECRSEREQAYRGKCGPEAQYFIEK